eukprot:CAMPEP_0174260872 /NCGR_PEP_ID=MMETSP0439-20130205/10822_1 /TAXON_ID=0 /ORGANISM="Stereomyxa ramosa, Strain Chinc5" /LENGTH=118 /DNA_ID=CAMNT_0015345223 /DNA_START=15 /DNA_END=371 /DNA_ORIENTATION=+
MATRSLWFTLGSLSAGVAVMMGAFGAHALKKSYSDSQLVVWETACRYQFYHSLALLAVALAPRQSNGAGYMFSAGIVLFSGSLYALTLTGIKKLGAITPIGGVCYIVGWGLLAWNGAA